MNKHMTFMFKQCTQHRFSNNTNRWMIFVSIPYEPIDNKFRTTIIANSWPMKFVMQGFKNNLSKENNKSGFYYYMHLTIQSLWRTPSSLMDLTTSPKAKTMEGEGVGARSLVRNTLGVEGRAGALGWD